MKTYHGAHHFVFIILFLLRVSSYSFCDLCFLLVFLLQFEGTLLLFVFRISSVPFLLSMFISCVSLFYFEVSVLPCVLIFVLFFSTA